MKFKHKPVTKAERREKKKRPKMKVSGRSVFVIQSLKKRVGAVARRPR